MNTIEDVVNNPQHYNQKERAARKVIGRARALVAIFPYSHVPNSFLDAWVRLEEAIEEYDEVEGK